MSNVYEQSWQYTYFSESRWEQYKNYGQKVSIYFLPENIGKGCGKDLFNREYRNDNIDNMK